MIVGAEVHMSLTVMAIILIDGIGGLWCVNVGHRRTEIINAIADQLNTLDYYSHFLQF